MKIVDTTSLPAVARPNGNRWNVARSGQLRILRIPVPLFLFEIWLWDFACLMMINFYFNLYLTIIFFYPTMSSPGCQVMMVHSNSCQKIEIICLCLHLILTNSREEYLQTVLSVVICVVLPTTSYSILIPNGNMRSSVYLQLVMWYLIPYIIQININYAEVSMCKLILPLYT